MYRELKKQINYNPDTGKFTWAWPRPGASLGMEAGTVTGNGYLHVKVNRVPYLGHRLAWYLHYGKWPEQIDHINGDKLDNRIVNLREATQAQNCYNKALSSNNKSGVKGVYLNKKLNKWHAQIKKGSLKLHLGYFSELEDAKKAYETKATELFGEFKWSPP